MIRLPHGLDPEDVISLLDFDGSGDLTLKEFETGMRRLLFGDPFQHTCLTMTLIGKQRKESAQQRQELKNRLEEQELKIDSILGKLASIKA